MGRSTCTSSSSASWLTGWAPRTRSSTPRGTSPTRARSGRCSTRATLSSATPATTPRSSTRCRSPAPALCRRYGARLMVDEAHGVGVLGARGAGACELFGAEDEVDIRMGTFSKSLASCGGFIAGPHDVIDFLRVQSRSFMFTAAAVPAAVGAALGALRIIRSDEGPELMATVLDRARYLHDGLAALGYEVLEANRLPDGNDVITQIVPVLVRDDWRAVLLWKALYDAGVYVNVAIYPAVQRGGALLRTSVMATHEVEHLDRALAVFEQVKDEVERMAPPDLGPPAAAPEAGADKLG